MGGRPWKKEELRIIEDNLEKEVEEICKFLPGRTYEAVKQRATKLGKKHSCWWTEEEFKILEEFYPKLPMDEFCKLLPNRDRTVIITYACDRGIAGYDKAKAIWKDWEKEYIKANWRILPDQEMAEHLDRTFRSVKWQREELGLFRMDKEAKNYENLSCYLRRNTSEWRKKYLTASNGKCELTGKDKVEVHHTYAVTLILEDIKRECPNIKFKDNFSDYSNEELEIILEEFRKRQELTKGICISKEIHKQFHKLYGAGYNTPEQWEHFINTYIN